MIVGGAAAAALVPPTEAAILLVTFHFAVGAHDFVALVHGTFKVGWSDPVIVEVDAHTVLEIHADLDGVISVDTVSLQTALLADGGKRRRFALEIVIDEVDPVRPHVTEWVAL